MIDCWWQGKAAEVVAPSRLKGASQSEQPGAPAAPPRQRAAAFAARSKASFDLGRMAEGGGGTTIKVAAGNNYEGDMLRGRGARRVP